jgi:hypothetical protein
LLPFFGVVNSNLVGIRLQTASIEIRSMSFHCYPHTIWNITASSSRLKLQFFDNLPFSTCDIHSLPIFPIWSLHQWNIVLHSSCV